MRLTDHFSLEEMVASQTASRLGIDNTPSPEVLERLQRLCETILEPARVALGPIIVSSGFRSPAVDAAISRAVPNKYPSAHQFGDAADLIPLAVPKLTLARWIVRHVPFDQVIAEYGYRHEPAWIHVSAAPTNAGGGALRGNVLRILHGTGYEPMVL